MDTLSNQFTYVIFDVSELSTIDFNLVEQTSAETCRLSIDRLQTLVKWTGSPPARITGVAVIA